MSERRVRKPNITKEQWDEIIEAYTEYVKTVDDPHMAGFIASNPVAWKYDVLPDDVYKQKRLSSVVKRAIQKQESYLLTHGPTSGQGIGMAIFRLKQQQHGYRDRFDYDMSTQGEKITFVDMVPTPGKKHTKS